MIVTPIFCAWSFLGLYGTYRKAPWGPACAALGSFLWAVYAMSIHQPWWAVTEAGYATASAAVAIAWFQADKRPGGCECSLTR
jgi:hypothetical protein